LPARVSLGKTLLGRAEQGTRPWMSALVILVPVRPSPRSQLLLRHVIRPFSPPLPGPHDKPLPHSECDRDFSPLAVEARTLGRRLLDDERIVIPSVFSCSPCSLLIFERSHSRAAPLFQSCRLFWQRLSPLLPFSTNQFVVFLSFLALACIDTNSFFVCSRFSLEFAFPVPTVDARPRRCCDYLSPLDFSRRGHPRSFFQQTCVIPSRFPFGMLGFADLVD